MSRSLGCLARSAVLTAALGASAPAHAQEGGPGRWLFRLRAVGLLPVVEVSSPVGGDVQVSDAWVPELDVSWRAASRVALELVAGTTRHRVRVTGSRIGDLDLGHVRAFPVALTAQAHPLPGARVQPYLGIGAVLAVLRDGEAPGPLISSVDYEDRLGLALQAGFDLRIGAGPWTLNVDAKKAFLDTRASLDGGFLAADVAINPWILGVGVGYRPRETG